MGYIARNKTTNKTYYSKGANKIANKIGCNSSTITKCYQKPCNKDKDKEYKDWIITKVYDIQNENRGKDIKSLILR